MDTTLLLEKIVSIIHANQTSSVFINGPFGSGKTFLLNAMGQHLPAYLRRGNVLGPFAVTDFQQPDLVRQLLHTLREQGYVDEVPEIDFGEDLAVLWDWLRKNGVIPDNETVVILLDLPSLTNENADMFCQLFSSIRSLEADGRNDGGKVCHVVAGSWDGAWLKEYYQQVRTSFPYTVGHNYFLWSGVSVPEVQKMIRQANPNLMNSFMLGSVLHEITDGCPRIVADILAETPSETIGFTDLMIATDTVAQQSKPFFTQVGQVLCSKTKEILTQLLIKRHLSGNIFSDYRDRLLISGLVKWEEIGAQSYVGFRSLFFELMIRYHGHSIGIGAEDTDRIRKVELMPSIGVLNRELYRLIHDIENHVRNFAVIQLSIKKTEGEELLSDQIKRENRKGAWQDGNQIANDRRDKARTKNIGYSELNPLIAYLTTGELADLIDEIARDMGNKEWRQIARSFEKTIPIRNAVMHNRLVDDSAIATLYQLQDQIYSALNAS